ncbi:AfsR/SARP family transcriptional regulator, partial [Kitasatospora nipponensis]|uniref:AfsR/SARP family transcriptional regulator n=1 Tax=Kitasatospora nipponensis TaxID=258049 RepID=UPI0031D00997
MPARPLVEVRCLGGFRLTVGGVEVDCSTTRPKALSLLKLLAVHSGTPVHREVLLQALWPDLPWESGIRNLQVTVSRLRLLLGPGVLSRSGASYGLALEGRLVSDVREFEQAAAVGAGAAAATRGTARGAGDRHATGGTGGAAALEGLRAARDWYTGDLLPEDGPAEWVVEERARLRARAC